MQLGVHQLARQGTFVLESGDQKHVQNFDAIIFGSYVKQASRPREHGKFRVTHFECSAVGNGYFKGAAIA